MNAKFMKKNEKNIKVKVNKSEQVGQKNKATKGVQFKTNLGGKKVRNLSSEILLRLSQDQNQLNEEYEEELKKKLEENADREQLRVSLNVNKKFMSIQTSSVLEADVIIEVLDARHPQDFRNEALEALADKENKTLVLLLNKVDLVPDAATVENWLKYYSQYYYCCSFRSITTKSRSKHSSTENLKTKAYQASKEQLSSGYSPLGCYQLMNILNKIARKDTTGSDAAPRPISVVFVGYPNVGKSSVINSMMRNTKHAVTGNKPGVTTRKSDFQLFSNIKLSDTPGVLDLHKYDPCMALMHGMLESNDESVILGAVQRILDRQVDKVQFLQEYFDVYCVNVQTAEDVVKEVAKKQNHYVKGGLLDLMKAANAIIMMWRSGKIPHYDIAPITQDSQKKVNVQEVEFCSSKSEPLDFKAWLA